MNLAVVNPRAGINLHTTSWVMR